MKSNKQYAQAIGKYLRLSASKARRILNQINGKRYQEAILILEFMPYKDCKVIKKILESAANNVSDLSLDKKSLIVKTAFANEGPKLKRFRSRAQGRAFSIHKPTSHITISVGN
uniref:Large ribosomal subunit protein uL22c n=1 Tax=Melanthalia intermedia TaxID=172989 RepID=A0A345UAV3_9FLOR|nr:hypothetical protein [Melanthalia intermedia]AXI97589.1 hypothetical protein [Melanthalia intermedia]